MDTWYDEDGYFEPKNIKPKDAEKLRDVCNWFNDRVNEIEDGVREVNTYGDKVIISWSWDDYQGGYLRDTMRETVEIPNDIFFSNRSLYDWQKEEAEKKKAKTAIAAKKKKIADKKRKETASKNALIKKEEKEREDYERLKQKYEGEK